MATLQTHGVRRPPSIARTNAVRALLLLLRVVVTVHALAIFAQPVLAGMYLSGDYDMLIRHGAMADAVSYIGYFQVVVAIALWAVGGVRWPTAASVAVVSGETAQYFAGMAGALDLHLPLGVLLVVSVVAMTWAIWHPRSERDRRR